MTKYSEKKIRVSLPPFFPTENRFYCTYCGQHMANDPSMAGNETICPACKRTVQKPEIHAPNKDQITGEPANQMGSSSSSSEVRTLRSTTCAWRGRTMDFLERHQEILRRCLPALAVGVVLTQTLTAFPISSPSMMVLVGMLLVGLVALNVRLGLFFCLVAIFLAIAFHNPFVGWLFAMAALVLLMILAANPYCAIVLLITPILLQMEIGLAIPLVAGLFLRPGSAASLAAFSAITGLGYMAVSGLHKLGSLVLNSEVLSCITERTTTGVKKDFFNIDWLNGMIAPNIAETATAFFSGLFHNILHPPLVFVEVAGWGIAAFCMARLSRRNSPLVFLGAASSAMAVLFLQNTLLRQLPQGFGVNPLELTGNLFLALGITAVLGFVSSRSSADGLIQGTTFGTPSGRKDWDSIGGLEDVKTEIRMAVQYHFDKRAAKLAKRYGVSTVKGILFYGPPGCGKTMFAKVIASQAGASFFTVSGADFRSKWYGEAEKNIATIFAEARKHAPSVIFFDEIDQMLGKREETMTSDSPERRVIAQFLAEMDGVKDLGNVLVVGATNEPDLIDPAALRPGRFDKLIYIPLPDILARTEVFRVYLRNKLLADDVDVERLSRLSERFSGADIADLCSKVAEQCLHQSLQGNHTVKITMAIFETQIKSTKPSVSLKLIEKYEQLQEKYNRRTIQAQTGVHEEREVYTWAKIGGLHHVRIEMEEAIELPLRRPEAYEKFKIRPPKGVLLFGPPGCGKTLMAKIVAAQCGAHFLPVDTKKENAESIKEWFLRARENKPCVLFFDEVDSLAMSRDSSAGRSHSVVTQLLVEMDGMKDLKQVIVIAATNRPDALDSAFMRPGRFDRLIYIPPPDLESRLQILQIHLAEKPLASDVDFNEIARQTEGYSGADLASVCYEVSMSLIRADIHEPKIYREDFLSALERVQPSIRPESMAYYDDMKDRFRRG